jgi:hypothetical protein
LAAIGDRGGAEMMGIFIVRHLDKPTTQYNNHDDGRDCEFAHAV